MRSLLAANMGLVLAGVVSFILMGAGQALYGPALPIFAAKFAITTGAAGVLVSAHWVGSVAGVAVMYLRGDSVTPRMALAAMGTGAALVGLGPVWGVTLAGGAVLGLGYGISTVIYNRRMLILFGAHGPSMLALLNAIFGIGAIGAPMAFLAAGSDPMLAFTTLAVLCAVTFALAGSAPPLVSAAGGSGRFVPRPSILVFGTIAIGMEACLIGLGPSALIAQGQTPERAAEFLSLFFLAFLAARLALVGFAGMIHPFLLFALALTGIAACAAGLAATAHPLWFAAAGAFTGLSFPGYYMSGTRLMGGDPRVSPTLIAAGMIGGISGPVIIGTIMTRTGDASFFALVAGFAGAAACAAFALRSRLSPAEVPA